MQSAAAYPSVLARLIKMGFTEADLKAVLR